MVSTTTATTRTVIAKIAADLESGSGASSAAAGCGVSFIGRLGWGSRRPIRCAAPVCLSPGSCVKRGFATADTHPSAPNRPIPARKMIPPPKLRLLLPLAALLLGLHVAKDQLGAGGGDFTELVADWFQPAAFLACGLAVLWRAVHADRRAPWMLLGIGLILYASGNVYYNLDSLSGSAPGFPSVADALWLSLYPFAVASLVVLLHGRFPNLKVAVWLDGVIGGGVVA